MADDAVNFDSLTREAAWHMRALLRMDTTNPPGNETQAAMYLRAQLADAGLEAEIVEPAPGRGSCFARLSGTGERRPLLLLSHTDVVPVERERWTVDPFGGEERDGIIYGRGAVDMKQMTAISLTLVCHFARQAQERGERLRRDLLFLAVADEERSGTYGMEWVVAHRPAWIAAEFALNEGGGQQVDLGGQAAYVCEVAQKGCVRVTLTATGTPGHASIPHQRSAVVALARAIDRLAAAPLPMHVTPAAREFLQAVAAMQPEPARTALLAALHPDHSEAALAHFPDELADVIRAMLRNTASVTLLNAGQAVNVIPGTATAQIDCRIIPGQTAETLTAELRARVGDLPVAVIAEPLSPGFEGTSATDLFAAIRTAVATHDPGAAVVPYLFPAVSDSRFLAPLGVIPHGFIPHRAEPGMPPIQALAHGHDERISLANVGFGLRVLYATLQAINA